MTKSSFNATQAEEAERELSFYLTRYPTHTVVQFVLDLRKELIAKKTSDRLTQVLIQFLRKPINAAFIDLYFKESKEDPIAFAKQAVEELTKDKSIDFCDILSALCEPEFEAENRKTLFRETTLSASLAKEFAAHLSGAMK